MSRMGPLAPFFVRAALLVNGLAGLGKATAKAATPMNVIGGVALRLGTGSSIRLVHDHPRERRDATARPEMNRQERVGFTVYVALAVLNVLVLTATGVAWWRRG